MNMALIKPPKVLDHKSWPPDYTSVFMWRQQQVELIQEAIANEDEEFLIGAKAYYSEHPVEFITHWCNTFDPRNAYAAELPTNLPFVLFKRQADLVEFLVACLEDQANGLIDKSRDMGATWICVGVSVWLWLFREGATVGWGSRKEELVDRLGDPKSIFEKIRQLVRGLPKFFWPAGFEMDTHATFMKLVNPENGATIAGEAGDNIGRGGRTLIYFKDESDHYQHPEAVEAALGDNTNVQIDISTPNGVGTIYDRKKDAGKEWIKGQKFEQGVMRLFTMDWSDHPTKTKEWHARREKAAKDAGLLHLFRQEVDRDPSSSLQGIIIKPEWVRAALDAHLELGFGDDGGWSGAFDPFDEGGDQHAFSMRKGVVLKFADDWGEGDTGEGTRHVIGLTLAQRPIPIQYDSVGIGAGVKSEANRLAKDGKLPRGVTFHPWDAGQGCINPEARVIPGDNQSPLNKDFYANLKAQGWWELARRFERTYRMRTEKDFKVPVAGLISLDSKIPKIKQLMKELSQPVMVKTSDLRLKVDKKPEGARSPNMGDSIMMNYFPVKLPMVIPQEALNLSGRR